MTVREIRQKWPEAEQALAREGEIIVTRDAKPVAKIVSCTELPPQKRPQFDFEAHERWLKKFWKGRTFPDSTAELMREREDRES